MTAWGKTGRVTLGPKRFDGIETTTWVHLHGRPIARVFHPRMLSFPHYGVDAEPPLVAYKEGFDSLDAAVMWVLRRAAPAVWREERGPVARVEPMWPLDAFRGLLGLARPRCAATRWAASTPGGHAVETFQSWADAMKAATS